MVRTMNVYCYQIAYHCGHGFENGNKLSPYFQWWRQCCYEFVAAQIIGHDAFLYDLVCVRGDKAIHVGDNFVKVYKIEPKKKSMFVELEDGSRRRIDMAKHLCPLNLAQRVCDNIPGMEYISYDFNSGYCTLWFISPKFIDYVEINELVPETSSLDIHHVVFKFDISHMLEDLIQELKNGFMVSDDMKKLIHRLFREYDWITTRTRGNEEVF